MTSNLLVVSTLGCVNGLLFLLKLYRCAASSQNRRVLCWSGGWLSLAECLAVINHRLLSSMEWYSLNYWRIYLVSAVKFILWVTYNFLHRRSTHDANEIIFTVDKSHIISYTWQYISNIENIVKSLLKWKFQLFSDYFLNLLPLMTSSSSFNQFLETKTTDWMSPMTEIQILLLGMGSLILSGDHTIVGAGDNRAVISRRCSINRI